MVISVYTEQPSQFLIFFGILALHRSVSCTRPGLVAAVGAVFLGTAGVLRSELLILNFAVLIAFFCIHLKKCQPLGKCLPRVVNAVVMYCTVPVSMLAFQYVSTGELGFVRAKFHNPGYMAWMRTWFALAHSQHDRFAFGPGMPDWPGFDLSAYPPRAFEAEEERRRVGDLLRKWRNQGYNNAVNSAFQELADERAQAHPLRHYALLPTMRMCHYWINIDGAQTILRVLSIGRPLSTAIVGLTLLLRGVFLLLALIGTYWAWLQPSCIEERSAIVDLLRLTSAAVVLRTLELGLLGAFVWAGLMEVRYVTVVFPLLFVLSIGGVSYCCRILGLDSQSECASSVDLTVVG
jgi:hypothetical protein